MPSTPFIAITVDGQDQFKRGFSRLDANFDDLTPIWPDVRDEFWRIESEQFDSEGSKGASGRWKNLSSRYELRKIAAYGDKPILEASGKLKASLTGDAEGTYYSTSKTDIAVGTTIPYGIYHQRGSDTLPKREPISLSEQQKKSMSTVIQKSLVRELRRGNYYIPVTDR